MDLIKALSIIIAVLLYHSCANSKKEQQDKSVNILKELPSTSEHNEEHEGESYSDSMINALVNSQNQKAIAIDTFETLHEIECGQISKFYDHTFTSKSVDSYKPYQTKIKKALQQLLGVTECICTYDISENYTAYIFYSDQLEGHSRSPISIITINKGSNSFSKLSLVKDYGNELGNYVISSELKPNNTIIRQVNHNVNYMHGIGEVDSIYLEREVFEINEKGSFELISTTIEKSSERNSVFER